MIEFSFPNASVEERYPETLKRLESKGKRHALKRTLRIHELADKLAFGTSIISLAQSKYGFSPLFLPHTVKKRIPTEYLDSFGFALIALAAQRALAARLEQDTDSLFAKRRTFWQSVAAWRLFSLSLSLFTSRTPTSFIRIYIHGWDHRSWSGSRPITKTPLLLTFATTREGLVRDLPSSYDFSYLNRDGRALVSLTADDIPTGSKAIVARLCLHRERTSPLSVSLPPPPRLPPPRPFLSTLRLSFSFSLSTLFDRRSCFALQRIVISSL